MGESEESLPELAAVIAAVRDQLTQAQQEGAGAGLIFRVGPVELEFELAVSYTGGGQAGVRLYVVTLGAKGEITSGSTQRLKVTLQPVDAATGDDARVAAAADAAGPPGGWASGSAPGDSARP